MTNQSHPLVFRNGLYSFSSFVFSVVCLVLTSSHTVQLLAQESKAPGLGVTPVDWEVVRETEVSGSQLAQIGNRLGLSLKSLFNTFVRLENQELQINTLTANSVEDAIKLQGVLRKGKANPKWVIQNGPQVYEFVVRQPAQARLAIQARIAFAIEPKKKTYHVEFDAIPIKNEKPDSAPDSRNQLFNLLLQVPTNPKLESEIITLSRRFEFASEFELAGNLRGIAANWKASGATLVPNGTKNRDSVLFKTENPAIKFGMPIVKLSADISMDLSDPRTATSEDRSSHLSTTPRWPVESQEIVQLVGGIVLPSDTDSIKLRKLLGWFADTKNMRYDGLTGSRYGTLTTLKQRFGRCWDYSDAMITLARASGLSSRQVYGWLHESEGHVWCDILVDGRWQMVDPTSGTACGIDYLPFCTTASGEFPILYSSKVSITEKK